MRKKRDIRKDFRDLGFSEGRAKHSEGTAYRMIVDWYAPGNRYIVSVPELAEYVSQPIAEGKTREEAIRRAEDMLDLLEGEAKREGRPLPAPAAATR